MQFYFDKQERLPTLRLSVATGKLVFDEDASDLEDIFITQNKIKDAEQSDDSSTFSVPLEAKFNNALSTRDTQLDKKPASRKQKPRLFFTPEEDSALQQGIRKYGFGNWQKMLDDKEMHFQKGRT